MLKKGSGFFLIILVMLLVNGCGSNELEEKDNNLSNTYSCLYIDTDDLMYTKTDTITLDNSKLSKYSSYSDYDVSSKGNFKDICSELKKAASEVKTYQYVVECVTENKKIHAKIDVEMDKISDEEKDIIKDILKHNKEDGTYDVDGWKKMNDSKGFSCK